MSRKVYRLVLLWLYLDALTTSSPTSIFLLYFSTLTLSYRMVDKISSSYMVNMLLDVSGIAVNTLLVG